MVKFDSNDVYAESSTNVTVKFIQVKIDIPSDVAFNFTDSDVISVNLLETATGHVLLEIAGTQTERKW